MGPRYVLSSDEMAVAIYKQQRRAYRRSSTPESRGTADKTSTSDELATSQTKRTMSISPSPPPSSSDQNMKAWITLASIATTALFLSLSANELGKVQQVMSARLDVCRSKLLECVTSTAASADEKWDELATRIEDHAVELRACKSDLGSVRLELERARSVAEAVQTLGEGRDDLVSDLRDALSERDDLASELQETRAERDAATDEIRRNGLAKSDLIRRNEHLEETAMRDKARLMELMAGTRPVEDSADDYLSRCNVILFALLHCLIALISARCWHKSC